MALRSVRMSKKADDRGRGPAAAEPAPHPKGRGTPARPGAVPSPVSGSWLVRGKDGRLTAYAGTDDAAVRWTEPAVGAAQWAGPDRLPLPSQGTVLSMAATRTAEGYVHLVAIRSRPAPEAGKTLVDVLHAIQYQTGRPLRDWQTIGSPYKDHTKAARMGRPSLLADTVSSVHVYVQNAEGRVSYRQQNPKGRFEPWARASVEGTPVTGQVYAVPRDDGVIEVLGPAAGRVLYWRRAKNDADFTRVEDQEPSATVAPGTLSSETTAPGRLTYYWRDGATTRVHAWRPGSGPVDLDGPGTGPLSVLRTPVDGVDCTILAGRGQDGRPVLAAYPTEDEEAGLTWVSSGEPCRGVPALALDGEGRVALAAIGEDGRLRITRQKPEQGLALEAWTTVSRG
ncbi:hypothetical protein [Streptomyces fuscigenes]|uniref:hypothetical protein n=1 Tax=Streptomyces fuscigenes TaxID=1528880 RepID=UPI001F34690C|nr:hypothetical protein [Streptomyces fuscigenes]MCF3961200.1 hypothetical protein [Streptomyces fuscigenes]